MSDEHHITKETYESHLCSPCSNSVAEAEGDGTNFVDGGLAADRQWFLA